MLWAGSDRCYPRSLNAIGDILWAAAPGPLVVALGDRVIRQGQGAWSDLPGLFAGQRPPPARKLPRSRFLPDR